MNYLFLSLHKVGLNKTPVYIMSTPAISLIILCIASQLIEEVKAEPIDLEAEEEPPDSKELQQRTASSDDGLRHTDADLLDGIDLPGSSGYQNVGDCMLFPEPVLSLQ